MGEISLLAIVRADGSRRTKDSSPRSGLKPTAEERYLSGLVIKSYLVPTSMVFVHTYIALCTIKPPPRPSRTQLKCLSNELEQDGVPKLTSG